MSALKLTIILIIAVFVVGAEFFRRGNHPRNGYLGKEGSDIDKTIGLVLWIEVVFLVVIALGLWATTS